MPAAPFSTSARSAGKVKQTFCASDGWPAPGGGPMPDGGWVKPPGRTKPPCCAPPKPPGAKPPGETEAWPGAGNGLDAGACCCGRCCCAPGGGNGLVPCEAWALCPGGGGNCAAAGVSPAHSSTAAPARTAPRFRSRRKRCAVISLPSSRSGRAPGKAFYQACDSGDRAANARGIVG